jgi:uncharacterized membrane protein
MRKAIVPILAASCVFSLARAFAVSPQAPGVMAGSRGTLEIIVLDEAGNPLPGAQVSLPGHRAISDANGSCKFNLLAGRYPVLIRKEGYRGRRITAGVRPAETTTERAQLQKLPSPRPPRK